jgi:acetoin utilization deacetylase AcuC-like enzyme
MKKKSIALTKSSPQKGVNNESLNHKETLDDFISKISLTPTKSSRQSPVKKSHTSPKTIQTPIKITQMPPVTPKQSEILVEDLERNFTGMKLQLHNPKRRSEERSTIEGTPVSMKNIEDNNINDVDNIEYNHQPKRLDLHPTPIRVSSNSNLENDLEDDNNLIKHVTNNFFNTNDDEVIPMEVKNENEVISKYEGNILVISSGSDAHDTGEHQENALRTALLCGSNGCLRRDGINNNIIWLNEDNNLIEAPITDLLRVHEYNYINHLEQKCKNSSINNHELTSINDNNKNGNNYKLPNFYAPNGRLDADTPLVEQSLEASRKFCSAAMYAVDKVMNTTTNQACPRAFVIGRPPGHHAGPNGCVPSEHYWKRPDMASSGFCLLNTVAIAAAYTRSHYGRQVLTNNILGKVNSGKLNRPPKIAIVDIDVHHGNGTEEIIRNLRPHLANLPLPSSWAPVSVTSYKPWLDETDSDDVFFASINLFAGINNINN